MQLPNDSVLPTNTQTVYQRRLHTYLRYLPSHTPRYQFTSLTVEKGLTTSVCELVLIMFQMHKRSLEQA